MHGQVYIGSMPATLPSSLRYMLPAAAAGTMGVDMSFTICADMSLATVGSDVEHSG